MSWRALSLSLVSGCFLVTGLENPSNGGSGATSDATVTTADTVSASTAANSSVASSSGTEGGAGGAAPISFVRVFEGFRFESVAQKDDVLYVGGTKTPTATALDGIALDSSQALFVASFSLTSGSALWAKTLRSYANAGKGRSVSLAIGSDRLVVGSTTEAGLWIETVAFDGTGSALALASCPNPVPGLNFFENVRIASYETQLAFSFNTSEQGATNFTLGCTPSGPTDMFALSGRSKEVLLGSYDGSFSNMAVLSAGPNVLADELPRLDFFVLGGQSRIAFSYQKTTANGFDAMVGIARREGNNLMLASGPIALAGILGSLGGVALGGADGVTLLGGAVRTFDGMPAVPAGAGLLRGKLLGDGSLAPAPREVDWDGINDMVNAGALYGTTVRVVPNPLGSRAIVAGWLSGAHKLATTQPAQGVGIGAIGQRSVFFADFDVAGYDTVKHAISLPLGPAATPTDHVVEVGSAADALVAAGVLPNATQVCGQMCGAAAGPETGCAFMLRQPWQSLTMDAPELQWAAGCVP